MKKLQLLGNLGKDAEITQNGDNTAIKFTVATTERQKLSGVWGDLTTWSNVTYWGKREALEKLLPHLKKGRKVYVDGKFFCSIYNEKPVINLTAENLSLC